MKKSENIRIRKGLDIIIPGQAERVVSNLPLADSYAVKPTDYVGVVPRLLVSEGDNVLAGSPLFEDKNNEGIPFVSPVSGTVQSIVRGEKRKLLSVVVKPSATNETKVFNNINNPKEKLIASGLWNLLRQRPFGIVPRKESSPKAVFISGFDSSPMSVDIDFAMQGREEDFQQGVNILAEIGGTVHLSLCGKTQRNSFLTKIVNAQIHYFDGPHPSGLPGTHIAFIDPINKGETVWTVNAQDVATIGHLFRTGGYCPERAVALCGPTVEKPQYYHIIDGANIASIFSPKDNLRIICGDVLSGTSVSPDGHLCASCDKISLLPEGNYYDFLGWLRPNFKKFSFSHTFLSGFLNNSKLSTINSKLDYDTGTHGSVRPLFVTGTFEKLTPLDIYPMQLIKACIVGDIELMENLGIYEVEPEDLALCEFADTSKTEIQTVIRSGLEKIRKEGF